VVTLTPPTHGASAGEAATRCYLACFFMNLLEKMLAALRVSPQVAESLGGVNDPKNCPVVGLTDFLLLLFDQDSTDQRLLIGPNDQLVIGRSEIGVSYEEVPFVGGE